MLQFFFYFHYLNICSLGGAFDHQIRHLGRAFERSFGSKVGNLNKAISFKVQIPGGGPRGWNVEEHNTFTFNRHESCDRAHAQIVLFVNSPHTYINKLSLFF